MHHVGRLADIASDLGVFDGHCAGLARHPLIDRTAGGSSHQSMTVMALAPNGRIDRHLHAFEKGIYVLGGEVTVEIAGRLETLACDDYAFIDVGVPHVFANTGNAPARWFEVCAPGPDTRPDDTVFVDASFKGIDRPQPFARAHFSDSDLPPPSSSIGLAGIGGANVGNAALKVIMNREFGATQFTLMVLEYAPGGYIKLHDHAFEEGFFFLDGAIEAVLDGEPFALKAGEFCWSGVTSSHTFVNRSDRPVRWLETQAPQPPSRHQARFFGDWEAMLKDG